jgi:hypothetical protein
MNGGPAVHPQQDVFVEDGKETKADFVFSKNN